MTMLDHTPASSAYTREDFADIYPEGIERHYWNHARNAIVARHCTRLWSRRSGPAADDALLDVGCGRGIVVRYLRERGLPAMGCDLGEAPPVDIETAPHLFAQTDVADVAQDVRVRVRLITLLDVVEHVADAPALLRSCLLACPRATTIYLTVPARMDIWSNYDVRNRHVLRYEPRDLRALARASGLRLDRWSYCFHALYPPARVLRACSIDRATTLHAPRGAPARLAHALLARGLALEERLLPARLPGSSLWACLSRG